MTTLSLTVDDELAQRARNVAAGRNTTLDHLLHEFLQELTSTGTAARDSAADRLAATIRDLSRPIGGKPYRSRDELHVQ